MAERAPTQPTGAPNRQGGPATFSFEVGKPVSVAQGARQGAPVRIGYRRGETPPPPAIRGDASALRTVGGDDLNVLLKFAGQVIQPKIEQEQNAAYWEGVKKAAAGQSIQEIKDEQPWYTKIFGDSSLVDGARAYTAQRGIDQSLAQATTAMPDLRKYSTDQVTQQYVQMLEQNFTGDPVTDAMMKQYASQQLPVFLKQHAKEHYMYLQEQTRDAQFGAWMPAAQRLQAMGLGYAQGTMTDEDMKVENAKFLASLAPLDGQDDEAYKKNLLAFYSKAAQDGNFHAVRLLEASGIRRFFTPEQQKSLDDTVFRYEQRAKSAYVSEYLAEDLGKLEAAARLGTMQPKEIAAAMRTINQAFRKATGIDEDVLDVKQAVESNIVAIYRRQKQGLDKQRQRAVNEAAATSAFSAGYGARSYSDMGISATRADDLFVSGLEQQKDKLGYLVRNALAPVPYVSPRVAGEMQQTLRASAGETYNEAFGQAYATWKKLHDTPNGGAAAAAAYYGDFDAQMMAYDRLVQDMGPGKEDIAYQKVFNQGVLRQPDLSKDERKALQSAISDVNQYGDLRDWIPGWSGPLDEASINNLAAVVSRDYATYKQYNPSLPPAELMKLVTQRGIMSGKYEMYGKYAWNRLGDEVPMSQYLGGVDKWAGQAFDEEVSSRLKAMGVPSLTSYEIIRAPDDNGEPLFYFLGYHDGISYDVTLRGKDIKARYDAIVKARATAQPDQGRNTNLAPGYTRPDGRAWGGNPQ